MEYDAGRDHRVAARLNAPMPVVLLDPRKCRMRYVTPVARRVRRGGRVELGHALVQPGLVGLERRDVVGPLLANGVGHAPRAPHRINGHRGPRESQEAKQLGGGRYLLRAIGRLHLA